MAIPFYQHLEKKLQVRGDEQIEALRRRLIAMLRDGQLIENRRRNVSSKRNLRITIYRCKLGLIGRAWSPTIDFSSSLVRNVSPRGMEDTLKML